MASANHIENVNLSGEPACRVLTISRGGTNCIHYLRLGIGLRPHRFCYFEKSLQLDRCLRNNKWESQLRKRSNFAGVANDIGIVRRIANDTDHFRMVRITGNYDVSAIFRSALRQVLHPGNERAGGVDHFCGALFQITLDLRRDAVGANYSYRVGIGFRWFVDRRYTQFTEPFHLLGVVNQWSKGTNGTNAFVQRVFDHFDRTFDAKTKPVFVS